MEPPATCRLPRHPTQPPIPDTAPRATGTASCAALPNQSHTCLAHLPRHFSAAQPALLSFPSSLLSLFPYPGPSAPLACMFLHRHPRWLQTELRTFVARMQQAQARGRHEQRLEGQHAGRKGAGDAEGQNRLWLCKSVHAAAAGYAAAGPCRCVRCRLSQQQTRAAAAIVPGCWLDCGPRTPHLALRRQAGAEAALVVGSGGGDASEPSAAAGGGLVCSRGGGGGSTARASEQRGTHTLFAAASLTAAPQEQPCSLWPTDELCAVWLSGVTLPAWNWGPADVCRGQGGTGKRAGGRQLTLGSSQAFMQAGHKPLMLLHPQRTSRPRAYGLDGLAAGSAVGAGAIGWD